MNYPKWMSDVRNYFKSTPIINAKVPLGRFGDLRYYQVKCSIGDYNLDFDLRKDAEAYKKLLTKSRTLMTAKIERMEIDSETGLHVTYPKEDK